MLQKIRDRISGWISIVVIALVGSAFVLFGVQYYFQQGGSSQDQVATVNGVTITGRELNQTATMMAKQAGTTVTGPIKQQLQAYALQSLVTQTALLTTLQKENFHVGLEQVKSIVMQAPEFQDNGQFSDQKLSMFLAQTGETSFAFFQRLQAQFIVNQVMQGVGASGFVLPSEMKQAYALAHQSRGFGYFLLPMQSFVSGVSISDAEIKSYYTTQAATFKTPEKVSVAYLLLSPEAIAKTVSVSGAQTKAYYESHTSNFAIPARWTVSQITIPLATNAVASDVDKVKAEAHKIADQLAHHQKPTVPSATVVLSEAGMNPTLQTLLAGMKVGESSKPLHTQNGFTVITLVKKTSAQVRPYASVEKQITALVQHERVNQILTQQSAKLADLTYTNPDSLKAAAGALQLPIQTSPLLTKSGEKTGLFANATVMNAIFSETVLQSNNNSAVITLQNGSQLVLRILAKEPSHLIPLATVHDQIKKTLVDQQAAAKAGVLAYQLQKELTAGSNLDMLAKKNHLVWHAVPLTVADKKSAIPADIVKAAFTTPLSAPLKNKLLGVQAVTMNSHDYAVVGILQAKNADSSVMSTSAIKSTNAQLTELWSQLLQHSFVGSVMQHSKVVVNKAA